MTSARDPQYRKSGYPFSRYRLVRAGDSQLEAVTSMVPRSSIDCAGCALRDEPQDERPTRSGYPYCLFANSYEQDGLELFKQIYTLSIGCTGKCGLRAYTVQRRGPQAKSHSIQVWTLCKWRTWGTTVHTELRTK